MLDGCLNPEEYPEPDHEELDDMMDRLYDEYQDGERSLESTMAAFRRAKEGRRI